MKQVRKDGKSGPAEGSRPQKKSPVPRAGKSGRTRAPLEGGKKDEKINEAHILYSLETVRAVLKDDKVRDTRADLQRMVDEDSKANMRKTEAAISQFLSAMEKLDTSVDAKPYKDLYDAAALLRNKLYNEISVLEKARPKVVETPEPEVKTAGMTPEQFMDHMDRLNKKEKEALGPYEAKEYVMDGAREIHTKLVTVTNWLAENRAIPHGKDEGGPGTNFDVAGLRASRRIYEGTAGTEAENAFADIYSELRMMFLDARFKLDRALVMGGLGAKEKDYMVKTDELMTKLGEDGTRELGKLRELRGRVMKEMEMLEERMPDEKEKGAISRLHERLNDIAYSLNQLIGG